MTTETQATEIKLRLAELPCLGCGGRGKQSRDIKKGSRSIHQDFRCPTCNGTGARFPCLREPCIGHNEKGSEIAARHGQGCQGRGWRPAPGDWTGRLLEDFGESFYFYPGDDGWSACLVKDIPSEAAKVPIAIGPTPELALLLAVEKACTNLTDKVS